MRKTEVYIVIDTEIEGYDVIQAAKLSETELNRLNGGDTLNLDFTNYRLQILGISTGYKVINAVNGYGINCKKDFESAIVKIFL